jgi:DNA processing protein
VGEAGPVSGAAPDSGLAGEPGAGGPAGEAPEAPVAAGDGSERERLARVALTRIADPGDAVIGALLRERSPVELVGEIAGGRALPGVSTRRAAGYRARAAGLDPGADLERIRALGGRFVIPGDAEWPAALDDLAERRPFGLWVLGPPSPRIWALRSVAVVGARACTEYGSYVAGRLAADLTTAGWTVVSGAAYGVDGAAHRGALSVGGATLGVLACGVDVDYPAGHAALIRRVATQGLLVGELPPGAHPTRSRFVLRNRVIAALARGTVVVEARHRSGSLVTARWAAELGRPVMGIPGACTSGLSEGVHQLLRDGATLVTRAEEVIEQLGAMGEDLAPPERGPVLPRDLLPPGAARVLEALPARGVAPLAEVAREACTTPDDALARLCELRVLGFVTGDGRRWSLAPRARGGAPGPREDR